MALFWLMEEKRCCVFLGLIMSIATDSVSRSGLSGHGGDCVFCLASSSGSRLWELVDIVAHVDSGVRSAMIVPARHVELMSELTSAEWRDISCAIEHIRCTWSSSSRPADANVVWNLGPSAGQSLAHLHCHVVERRPDGLLAGYGLRWWLKRDLRGTALLRLLALTNRHTRAGGFR